MSEIRHGGRRRWLLGWRGSRCDERQSLRAFCTSGGGGSGASADHSFGGDTGTSFDGSSNDALMDVLVDSRKVFRSNAMRKVQYSSIYITFYIYGQSPVKSKNRYKPPISSRQPNNLHQFLPIRDWQLTEFIIDITHRMHRERIILQLGARRDIRSLGLTLRLWNKRTLQTLYCVQHPFLSAWRNLSRLVENARQYFFPDPRRGSWYIWDLPNPCLCLERQKKACSISPRIPASVVAHTRQ